MPAEFTSTRRVQFAETDMAGIAHFANFFRWMEEAEHAMFRAAGLSVQMQLDGMEISWPRVSVGCEFVRPVRFEDELSLGLRVVRLGDKSINLEVEFTKGGERVALGKSTSVCCEVGNGMMRSIAIPPAIRDKLTGVAT